MRKYFPLAGLALALALMWAWRAAPGTAPAHAAHAAALGGEPIRPVPGERTWDVVRATLGEHLFHDYQPKVAVPGGWVTDVETLAPWDHPELDHIPPAQFIPLLKLSDQVHPFTRSVQEIARAQAAEWTSAGRAQRIAINLSARNLIADPELATALLEQVNHLGVGPAIDGYGTGYSSLAYLRRLPVDMLKLDRAFISDLPRDDENQVIVRSTIRIAHELGLRVLAEGVEDGATRALLTRLGCDESRAISSPGPCPPDTSPTGWRMPRTPRLLPP